MMSKVIAFEPIVNSLKLFNKLLTEKYLLGIGTLEFLKSAWPSALVGRPFNGVTSDIFLGIVFFRIGKAPETLSFSLLIAS